MKRQMICAALILALLLGLCPAAFAASEGSQSKGAPPAQFDIYIQVGDDTQESERLLLGSVTGQQMRQWASRDTLKYSAASYYGNQAGRIVREWITLADFTADISAEFGVPVTYQSGDYFIMGEDLTKDETLSGYDRAALTGNWYSYDEMIGKTRYYYPNWTSSSEEGAIEVPTVIGLRSYGGSSGMSDAVLDIYAGSVDYLWAYVVYYGQTACSELNYPHFYYGQEQASFRYEREAVCCETIRALLTKEADAAKALLAETAAGTDAAKVAEGQYCVDAASYNKLTVKNTEALQLLSAEEATNGAAYDKTSMESITQDSFEGKTVVLACDIDAADSRPHIGTDEYAFSGTFEGGGHTISNLSITFSNDGYSTNGYLTGLFGHIGEKGAVRNLTAAGKSGGANLSDYVGGLAGQNEGLIENCVSEMTVTGPASARTGGIAAVNSGTIKNCANLDAVTGGGAAGGLAGENSGTITGCVNAGAITGEALLTGGIAGKNAVSGTVKHCIASVGTLLGTNAGMLTGSYTTGKTAAQAGNGTMQAVYTIGGTSENGVTALENGSDFKEAVLTALNQGETAFRAVEGGYTAEGYLMNGGKYLTAKVETVDGGTVRSLFMADNPTTTWAFDEDSCIVSNCYNEGGSTPYALTTSSSQEMTISTKVRVRVNLQFTVYEIAYDAAKADHEYDEKGVCACGAKIEFTLGDVNGDDTIDIVDAMLALRIAADKITPTAAQKLAADVNGDGKIDVLDAQMILNYALGIIEKLGPQPQ